LKHIEHRDNTAINSPDVIQFSQQDWQKHSEYATIHIFTTHYTWFYMWDLRLV